MLHLLGNVVPVASGIITAPFTARAVGAEGRAVLVVVTTISVGLLILGTFGLAWITRQQLSVEPTSLRTWKARAVRVDLVSFFFGLLVGWVLALWLHVTSVELIPLVVAVVLSTMSATRVVWANSLIASGRAWGYGVANLASASVVVAAVIAAYSLDVLNLATALWIQCGGLAVQVVVVAALAEMHKSTRGFERRTGPWVRVWRRPIRRSVVGQVADFVVARSDLLVVGLIATRSEFGLYSVPCLLTIAMYQVTMTVIQHSWGPRTDRSDRARVATVWQTSVIAGFAVTAAGGLGIWLVFLPLFGAEFSGSESYVPPACAMALAISSIVPAIQHAAISPDRFGIVPTAIATIGAVAVLAKIAGLEAIAAVTVLSVALFLLGAGHTVRVAGRGSLGFSPRGIAVLLRG